MTDARVGRDSVRVLVKPNDTRGRVGRESARALLAPTATPGRVGRESVRSLLRPSTTPGRLGRESLRVLVKDLTVTGRRAYGWGLMLGGAAWSVPAVVTPGLYRVDVYGSPTGAGTINILLPGSAAVDDLAIITTGHRNVAGAPTGATVVAESIGGQSTANQQSTRTSWLRLNSTHVSNGYVPFTSNWGGTAYGFVSSVQLARSNVPGYLATFDVASAGVTSTNATSKQTPALTFNGLGRVVFHQATFFQNSGVASGSWGYPQANDNDSEQVDREIGGICRETYVASATSCAARTWSIGGTSNGGMGTTAVATYLLPI